MVSIEVNSAATPVGGDFSYLIQAVQAVGFEYSTKPYDGEITPGAMAMAQAAARDVISESDVADLKDELIKRSSQPFSSEVREALATLERSVGAPRSTLASLNALVERAQADRPDGPEQQMKQLVAQIEAIDQDQRKLIDELYRDGKISKETHDNAIKALDQAESHAPGSPEWRKDQGKVAQTTEQVVAEAKANTAPGETPHPAIAAIEENGKKRDDLVSQASNLYDTGKFQSTPTHTPDASAPAPEIKTSSAAVDDPYAALKQAGAVDTDEIAPPLVAANGGGRGNGGRG